MTKTAHIVLRPAHPDELDQLVAYSRAMNEEDGHPIDSRAEAAMVVLLSRPELGQALMIEHDGTIVGSIILCFGFSIEFGGVDAIIDEFYVEPAYRGRGIGRAALDALEGWAEESSIVALHLEVMADNPAYRLYGRHGYVDRNSRFMSKRLVQGTDGQSR